MSFETSLVQALSGLLYASATAGIAVITPKIKSFLYVHTTAKNAAVESNAIDSLSKIIDCVVADFNQRIVNDSKAKQAFTEELAIQTKKDALAAIQSQGAQFIQLISGNTNDLISTLIEKAVANQKGAVKQ